MQKLRAGIIGSGGIAECHIRGMMECGKIEPYALCDINHDSLNRIGEKYSIPEQRRYSDYRELLACPQVDMVSICTPNATHYEIAMAVVKSGKPYALEKPIAMTLEQAKELNDATLTAGLANAVCFTYRFLPAVRKAKSLIESGTLGKIYHVYAQYIEGKDDNENIPLLWRYQKELAGSGSLGDLGSHMLDMMHHLVGEFVEVAGTSGIIVPKRQKLDGSGLGDVTTEDYFHALATMEGGVSATVAFTKFAFGRKNAHRLEIYGSKGGLIYTLENGLNGFDHLYVCLGEELGRSGNWVDMTLCGYDGQYNAPSQMECVAEIMNGREEKTAATITDGYYVQAVMEAMLRSAEDRVWCSVADFLK